MTYVLLDNATLTGVQRLTGDIPVRSLSTVDGDIAALENLVESILFYDQILILDDYKEEYQAARKTTFSFARFLLSSDFDLPSLAQSAKQEADRIRPEIRGGEFADKDFREFLDLLKMHIICTWD